MAFQLTILGSSAAVPAHGRYLSGQVLQVGEELFLIDCGEGTQMRMLDFKIKSSKINHIFISHLHGDHFFGLIGLLMTFGLSNRTTPLNIYSPTGLKKIIELQLEHASPFPIVFIETNPEEHTLLCQTKEVDIYSIPLVHRAPCHGFLFVEKSKPANILKEKIDEYKIPFPQIPAIKNGADFTTSTGLVIANSELVSPSAPPKKFAYCSDTQYSEAIIPIIKNVNLLYHEATFTHDMLEQAQKTMHTTAHQAASIALQAEVNQLVIGHFSARYDDLNPLLEEAQAIFENTSLAIEGETICVI